jgi:hypothetical protein
MELILRELAISSTKFENLYALVSDEDFEFLSSMKWYVNNHGYVYTSAWSRTIKKPIITKLHRLVTNAPNGLEVDHINRDKLDNRRENLRLCSHAENMRNRSVQKNNKTGYKGITYSKERNKWQVHVYPNGRARAVGRFKDFDLAVVALLEAQRSLS